MEGKAAAKKSYIEKKMYDGEEVDDERAETYSKIMIYLEVLGLGYCFAMLFFVSELTSKLCRRRRFRFSM